MRHAHGFLVRFIDLGLLLLMAFLVVAELNPTHQESLPGSPDATSGSEVATIYRLTFDGTNHMRLIAIAGGRTLCDASGLDDLPACIRRQPPGRLILTPQGRATVQQLVGLLDLCERQDYDCTVALEV